MASPSDLCIGASLQKLDVTASALLARTGQPTCVSATELTPAMKITNEMVVDLYHFMCRHSECTYVTLTQWLSCLYGEKWPSDQLPTVRAITQNVKWVLAKMSKLKMLPTSSEKDQKIFGMKSTVFL